MTTPTITDADRELLDLIECEVIHSDALAAIAAHREAAVAEYRERLAELIRLLCISARQAYRGVMFGNTPILNAMQPRVTNPRPGDLVLEISSLGRVDSLSRIGRLICKRREFVKFSEEEGGYYDDFTYIEQFDGAMQRWSNCEFVAVFESDRTKEQFPDKSTWAVEAMARHGLKQLEAEGRGE